MDWPIFYANITNVTWHDSWVALWESFIYKLRLMAIYYLTIWCIKTQQFKYSFREGEVDFVVTSGWATTKFTSAKPTYQSEILAQQPHIHIYMILR